MCAPCNLLLGMMYLTISGQGKVFSLWLEHRVDSQRSVVLKDVLSLYELYVYSALYIKKSKVFCPLLPKPIFTPLRVILPLYKLNFIML